MTVQTESIKIIKKYYFKYKLLKKERTKTFGKTVNEKILRWLDNQSYGVFPTPYVKSKIGSNYQSYIHYVLFDKIKFLEELDGYQESGADFEYDSDDDYRLYDEDKEELKKLLSEPITKYKVWKFFQRLSNDQIDIILFNRKSKII